MDGWLFGVPGPWNPYNFSLVVPGFQTNMTSQQVKVDVLFMKKHMILYDFHALLPVRNPRKPSTKIRAMSRGPIL